MQLQVAIIALKSSHFNNTGLFQIIESKFLVFKLIHILNDSRQCVDKINDIVALIINQINISTGSREFTLDALSHHSFHQFRMRLVTNFEYIIFVDYSEASSCRLEVV